VRSVAGALQITLFRRGRMDRTPTAGRELAFGPGEAHRQILEMFDGRVRHASATAPHDEPALLPRRRRANA
jgi:hypothetical protein